MTIFAGNEKDRSFQLERVAFAPVGPSDSDVGKNGSDGGKPLAYDSGEFIYICGRVR